MNSGRAPQTPAEHVFLNCRPQPAIPALLVLLVMVIMPALLATSQPEVSDFWLWLMGSGVVLSAGLAVAAGFCSLAPQVLWIGAAIWALSLFGRLGLGSLQLLVQAGMACVALMAAVQVWRIATARFVPTVMEAGDD